MGSLCAPATAQAEAAAPAESAGGTAVELVAQAAPQAKHTGPRFLQTQRTVVLKHPSHPHQGWHKFGLVVREWLPNGALAGHEPLFPGGPPKDPLFPPRGPRNGERCNALLVVAIAYTGDPDVKFQFGPSPQAGKDLVTAYNQDSQVRKDWAARIMEGDLIVNVNNCIFERSDAEAGEYPEKRLKEYGKSWLSELMVLELQLTPEERGADLVWELTLERGDESSSAIQRKAELLKQCTPEHQVKAVKL